MENQQDKASALEAMQRVWQGFCQSGLLALPFAGDSATYLTMLAGVAGVSPSFAVTISVHTGVGYLPLRDGGVDTIRQAWLEKIKTGEAMSAFALTEPAAGSDTRMLQTRYRPDVDGYVLNGTKIFCSNAQQAGVFMVLARPEGPEGDKDSSGFTAFVVPAGTTGLTLVPGEPKFGLRGSDWAELVFVNLRLPADHMLGEAGRGRRLFLESLVFGRLGIAAIGWGICERVTALVSHVLAEKDEVPQGQQFALADMATRAAAAGELVLRAAKLKDAGADVLLAASQAKLFASEAAFACADSALRLVPQHHKSFATVERLWRDARALPIVEGTSEIQQMIIGKAILG